MKDDWQITSSSEGSLIAISEKYDLEILLRYDGCCQFRFLNEDFMHACNLLVFAHSIEKLFESHFGEPYKNTISHYGEELEVFEKYHGKQ